MYDVGGCLLGGIFMNWLAKYSLYPRKLVVRYFFLRKKYPVYLIIQINFFKKLSKVSLTIT